MTHICRLIRIFLLLLFTAFGGGSAVAMSLMPPNFQYTQLNQHHTCQATDIGFAARAPPLAVSNVALTGGFSVSVAYAPWYRLLA